MSQFCSEFDTTGNYLPPEKRLVTHNSYINQENIQDIIANRVSSFLKEKEIKEKELAISSAIQELFSVSETAVKAENLKKITSVIYNFLQRFPLTEINVNKQKLINHVGLFSFQDFHPWIDLEAAKILELEATLLWSPSGTYRPPKLPPLAPQLRIPLEIGQYVPLQHLLHGLSIATFFPKYEKNYPIPLTSKLPNDFLSKIKRSDVIRGANVHALFLGIKFPIFASTLPGVLEDLWQFMFKDKYSALAGIELYNEVFYQFSLNLGKGIVRSVDHVLPVIFVRVKESWKNGRLM